jgi:hypothetical protein
MPELLLIVSDFIPKQNEEGLKLGPTKLGLHLRITNESSLRSIEEADDGGPGSSPHIKGISKI